MTSSRKKSLIHSLQIISLFILGTGAGLLLWNKILLPFHNPDKITGPLSLMEFNPSNDIFRFISFVAIPSLLLFMFQLSGRAIPFVGRPDTGKHPPAPMLSVWLLIAASLLLSLNTPTYHASGPFDTFHEGETLGSAMSLLEGKKPYKDVLFSHGVFYDPLRTIAATKLFGESIGATRALTSFLKILSFLFLAILILRLFNGNGTWALLCFFILFLLIPRETFIVLPRDLITFLYLILLTRVSDSSGQGATGTQAAVNAFLLAAIPLVTFGISIDRAFYLTALYILLFPILLGVFFRKKPWRMTFVTASILGLLAGVILLLILLQGAVTDFVDFVFIHMPKTKELADGLPYPLLQPRFLTMLLLISGLCFWLTGSCLSQRASHGNRWLHFLFFCKKYFNAIALFFLAVFCFRNALGRSDEEHLAYSTLLPILLFLYITIHFYLSNHINRAAYRVITLAMLITASLYTLQSLYTTVSSDSVLEENFPIHRQDREFIPPEYTATISFLKSSLTGDQKFITLSNEASWYYFLKQASPTRFPLVWFALSQKNQKQFINSMEQQNIRFVLYRNRHWANTIDGIPNSERLPILFDYISKHYHPLTNMDGNEIWEKN